MATRAEVRQLAEILYAHFRPEVRATHIERFVQLAEQVLTLDEPSDRQSIDTG